MNRDIFKAMGGWEQLLFLCFFAFIGYIAAIISVSIISPLIFNGLSPAEMMQSVSFVRISQLIVAASVFLLPSLVFAYLFAEKPSQFLMVKSTGSLFILIFAILLVVVIQPFVNAVGYLNEQITLPDSMSSIQNWMKEKEESSQSIINLCFEDKSFISLVCNILVIAVMAGIAEEFFFRGCMQRIFEKIVLNSHLAIWLTAFIFSAVHLQFYGFLPRLLLGAMLGYLFVWSRSIWVPVLIHVLNNAIIVIFMQINLDTPQYEIIQNLGVERYIWISILSLSASLITLLFIYKGYKKRFNNL